ncbi:MAG: hypothetical protein CSA65_05725 [Proteobacteria bacterium]|nr:MAG: hypothetical protein CSB49_02055 [Pseudomonadota bacterium]PIE18216.1 MAG: hypothetical protein CSA65_05725 [Pseudomonadota bacterium]
MTRELERGLALLTLALLPLGLVASCAGERARPRPDPGSGSSEVPCRCECPEGPKGGLSTALLSRLATARALHHQADLLLSRGDNDGAIAKVRGILALDLDPRWPEAEEVRLDATARVAKLLADKKKDLAAALALVDAELANKPRPSFYSANLHSTRGDLLEIKVKTLDAAGKKAEAKKTAREALAAFERSITINKVLQETLRSTTPRDSKKTGGQR